MKIKNISLLNFALILSVVFASCTSSVNDKSTSDISVSSGSESKKQNEVVSDLATSYNNKLYFGFDRSDLSSENTKSLNEIVGYLKSHSDCTVSIVGHADERGSSEYNDKLGERRANSVAKYIEGKKLASVLSVSKDSMGNANPVVKNAKNEEDHALNRRSVIEIVCKK